MVHSFQEVLQAYPRVCREKSSTMLINVLFIIVRSVKHIRDSLTEELIKKESPIYTMEYCSSVKKWHHDIFRYTNESRKIFFCVRYPRFRKSNTVLISLYMDSSCRTTITMFKSIELQKASIE